jgi:AraC-like DNA-binding protein
MSHSHSNGFHLIHRDDLLNALLAIQSASQAINFNQTDDRERQIYQAGFDAALLAVAQMLGQSETYLARKTKLTGNSL